MARRIIDLSIAIETGLPSDPEMMIPKVDYITHAQGAEQMEMFFPGLKKEQLPGGLGWSVEFVQLTTHSGTHLDAPYHYHPFMDKGKPALTIDEVPLEWCFQDGVLLDFSHKGDGERITAQDVREKLFEIGYAIKPLDIVLVRTGADAWWGKPEYLVKGAGMTRESTLYLLEQGVKVVGIDAWSWDRPLPVSGGRIPEDRRSFRDLGSALCRHRKRLLPHGENDQPGQNPRTAWVQGVLLPRENQVRIRRMDPAGGDHRRVKICRLCFTAFLQEGTCPK